MHVYYQSSSSELNSPKVITALLDPSNVYCQCKQKTFKQKDSQANAWWQLSHVEMGPEGSLLGNDSTVKRTERNNAEKLQEWKKALDSQRCYRSDVLLTA